MRLKTLATLISVVTPLSALSLACTGRSEDKPMEASQRAHEAAEAGHTVPHSSTSGAGAGVGTGSGTGTGTGTTGFVSAVSGSGTAAGTGSAASQSVETPHEASH